MKQSTRRCLITGAVMITGGIMTYSATGFTWGTEAAGLFVGVWFLFTAMAAGCARAG